MKTPLSGKTIILGITGGIASYKSPDLVRKLKKAGADVYVVITPNAEKFVTETSLGTVSEHAVLKDVFPKQMEGSWTVHIHLARSADLFLIAPCTANTLAKLANGLADNMLTNLYLALPTQVPVLIAPAMDTDMYIHPATQENLAKLKIRGHFLLNPESGSLASGFDGIGRLPENDLIVEKVSEILHPKEQILKGKKVLISAGPTREKLDPVRYISNYSSGKMGYSLAHAAKCLGGDVILVSGTTHLESPVGIEKISIESASEMAQAMHDHFKSSDIIIMTAAVADFRPENIQTEKIKKTKNQSELTLNLVKNPDILSELGAKKTEHQVLIGFALETHDEEENARQKLSSKNCNMIVMNNPLEVGAGFNSDTNKVTLFTSDGKKIPLSIKPKLELAFEILEYAGQLFKKNGL